MDTNKLYFENVPARLVLYLFAFTCSMTSYFLRTVMNLTILAMVKNVNVSQGTLNNSENLCRLNRNVSKKANDYGGTLEWSADAQYLVLTSFFWTYIASQLLGAIITHKFGAKLTILLSILTASLCTLFIPLASELHHLAVIFLQLLNGGAQAVVWPAMYAMVGWWIPIYERSRYLTSMQGATIGTALSYFISGYIIAYFGWKYVFYFFGVLGLVWCLGWYLLIYDKPELHPRISSDELIHIIRNREQKLLLTKQKVPWKYIFSSVPVWAIAVSSFGRHWAFITTTTYGPVYLKTVVGLEVQTNGMWSSLISLASFFTTAMLSYISDKLLIYKVLSTVAIRKMFAGIGQISSGLLCILMAYLSCEINTIVAVWVLIQIFVPINSLGTMVNIVDVAPNFSAAAISFIQIILLIPSILSTFVAKQFLEEGSTFESWKGIFNTSGGVLLVSYLIYFLFGSADRQKWDNEVNLESVDTEELEGLVWCLGWYLLIYDKPELQPRISSDELIHIIRNREQKLLLTKQKVPWKYIFSSVPLWAIAVSAFGRYWAFVTASTYGPVYLKTVVGLEVQTNGMWSSLISLASFSTTVILSYISDKLLTYKVLSTVATRKMFAGIGQIGSGLLCILMVYLSCEINTIVAVWVLIQIFVPINSVGTMVNIIDVAPNFSAAAVSFIQIILLIPSILSTYVAKQFLEDGSTFESWKGIFNTSGGVLLVSYLIYFLFGSADRQKWDNEVNLESVDTEELEGLDK